MSAKRASVVIPIYNVTKYLKTAIDSVLSDPYPHIEIVVVNDGSGREATANISAICAAYPQVKLVHQPNKGQAQARCTGVHAASGEYIIFLDADDILLPEAVSYLVQHIEAHPDAIAVYGTKILIEEDGTLKPHPPLPTPSQVASGDVVPALLIGMPLFSHGNICMRRRFVAQVDFPKRMRQGEDWVTWCRLALLGDIIYVGDRPLLGLRKHGNNVSSEVFARPAELFKMFRRIYYEPAFIERFGEQKLAQYRNEHMRNIHEYLRYSYIDRKQLLRAKWHEFILRYKLPHIKKKIRVLHMVKWFYAGGAERIVSSLLAHSDHSRFEHRVVSLSNQQERLGAIEHTLQIPYKSFEFADNRFDVGTWWQCFRFVRDARPHLLKGWLAPGNIAAAIIGAALRKPVIWGMHNMHGNPPFPKDVKIERRLAGFLPRKILCCSQRVYDGCVRVGYKKHLLHMIENGTDTSQFCYRAEGRRKVREELGIEAGSILIGMAAECVPVKRHQHFLIAARLLLESYPSVQFLLCGKNTSPDNIELRNYVKFLGLEGKVHLLGIRDDMPDIYSALDIHTLDSRRESFGLATTEALSCETLCVATDVGVMREALEGVGVVYPVCDEPIPLVEAWKQMLSLPEAEKQRRRQKGRKRIAERYSIRTAAKAYDDVYWQVTNGKALMRVMRNYRRGAPASRNLI